MQQLLTQENLAILWFILLGILLIGYAVLDGFDLGVGIMHLTARNDHERRIYMNSIGPLWDGNEVWLVTFGGAMFAAFPNAYAAIFEGFYLALMLVLYCLIFRAVSLEFRSKTTSRLWRRVWDFGFFGSSLGATLLFGVAVGNALAGLPLDANMEIRIPGVLGITGLLGWYPLLVGLMAVALFALHGTVYLWLKTEAEIHERLVPWMWRTFAAFCVLYLAVTISTAFVAPHADDNLMTYPLLWIIPVLNFLAILNISRSIYRRKPAMAFVSSSASIAALAFLFMTALFPNLIVSSIADDLSLSVYEASSSLATLKNMSLIALLGLPFVFAYTAVIYWTFWGKVQLGEHSY